MNQNISLRKNMNIRDLGGIENDNGLILKPCCFIRSSQLFELDESDIHTLVSDYSLKTIIDLRNDKECIEMPDVVIPHTKYYHLPLLRGRTDGITREKREQINLEKSPNMCELYKTMVASDFSRSQLKKIFKIIMNPKNSCVLFHCSVGKDRTGIVTLLLLTMLGVPLKVIYQDYMFSNEVTHIEGDKMYEFFLAKTHNEEFANEVRDTYLAFPEYLDSAIEYMESHYGSILEYIQYGLHISNRKIEKFKKQFLVHKEG